MLPAYTRSLQGTLEMMMRRRAFVSGIFAPDCSCFGSSRAWRQRRGTSESHEDKDLPSIGRLDTMLLPDAEHHPPPDKGRNS